MADYDGRSKKLARLAETKISQSGFDFVADIGYERVKKYIKEGAEKALKRQFVILFRRRPDLYDDLLALCRDKLSISLGGEEINEERVIDYLMYGSYWYFDDILGGSFYKIEESAPLLLKTLIESVIRDGSATFTRSLATNLKNYLKEVKEFISYIS